ncbi:sulfoxide reductase heme-binding subunit YedZ [Robbsia sp. Bb-Pol-6]|uniref:Protein-methionine-sulfoxide reductase heme-binding subunit MsrQ n=1 Tax=Robbsia betulipollinis TaxID=2981849 RepID=A0ABT3ZP46_9BURK|nr:protein-methionine-sulfoxide reductase heme-binding subunit MsrQ [Robbsia betulipollinis]MCY0388321.1 sulfoxide reductase heme-binding subunit YedZ [Robbsia betulipollinis]
MAQQIRPQASKRAPSALDTRLRIIKPLVFLAGLYPLARLVFFGFTDRLSANPVQFVTFSTGTWALVILCVTLAVTPLRRLTGANWLIRLRRMIGLFAFFYALLHFVIYLWFDQGWNFGAMLHDVWRRPFIMVGFGAFVLLLLLALTSPKAAVRRLGRHWQTLHRLIYLAAGLALLHFWWMKAGKNDLFEPKIYVAVVAVLLAFRVVWTLKTTAEKRRVATRPR